MLIRIGIKNTLHLNADYFLCVKVPGHFSGVIHIASPVTMCTVNGVHTAHECRVCKILTI